MIIVQNKKLSKKHLAIIITASVLALLIIASIVVNAVVGAYQSSLQGSGGSTPPEIIAGEAILNNRGVVYPYVSSGNIVSVAVDSHVDEFVMMRHSKENKYDSHFTFYYTDQNGNMVSYYPNIMSEDSETNYTDFYAIEQSDGLNAYKMNYLLAAIGALYFTERIYLSDDAAEKAEQLNRYGLGTEERETVYFTYLAAKDESLAVSECKGTLLFYRRYSGSGGCSCQKRYSRIF